MLQAVEMKATHGWCLLLSNGRICTYVFLLFQLPPERKSCFGIRCS
jgi:hypothetical protein